MLRFMTWATKQVMVVLMVMREEGQVLGGGSTVLFCYGHMRKSQPQ